MQRLKWLDIMKGIGICLIMLSHTCRLHTIGIFLFASYIPLFFLTAGYTIKITDRGINLKSKAKRLLYPYLFYAILFTIVHTIKSHLIGEASEASLDRWIGILYGRLTLMATPSTNNVKFLVDGPLWFLPALFTAFIPVNYFISLKNSRKPIIALLFLGYTMACCYLPIFLPWCLDEFLIASLFIVVGHYFKRHIDRPYNNIVIPATVLYLILVYFNGNINMAFRDYGIYNALSIIPFFFIGIIGSYLIYCLSIKLQPCRLGDFFSIAGRDSLRLMCIHIPLFEAYDFVIKTGIESFDILLKISLAFAVSRLIGILVDRLKHRIPLFGYL